MQEELKFQLLQARIELQEHLYTRLRVELHDKVAQLLGSVNMLLGVAMKDISQLSDTLNIAQASLRSAIQEIRTLSKPDLMEFNVLEHLQWEVAQMNASGTIPVKLITSGNKLSLSTEKQVVLFCILLEILQNCSTSASSKGITIKISCNKAVKIVIRDDSQNWQPISEKIQHRIELLQGIQVHHPNDNTTHILLPV